MMCGVDSIVLCLEKELAGQSQRDAGGKRVICGGAGMPAAATA